MKKLNMKKNEKVSLQIPSANEQFSKFMNRTSTASEKQLLEINSKLEEFHKKADEKGVLEIILKEELFLQNANKLRSAGWIFTLVSYHSQFWQYNVTIKL